MQLCLRDNDPIRTLYLSPDGEELYKAETPTWSRGITTVRRFHRNASVGLVSLEVGRIEPLEPVGARLLLCAEDMQIVVLPPRNQSQDS